MHGSPTTVKLTVPAMASSARVARLVAAGLAGDLGFTVDEIDELRIAVDELFFLLVGEEESPDSVELLYRTTRAEIRVDARRSLPAPSANIPGLVGEILGAAADRWGFSPDGPSPSFSLQKRRRF